MLITRGIRVGDTISFDYDHPKENGPYRIGILKRMYRAKKNNLLIYVLFEPGTGYRQFHYRGMRNIRVSSNAAWAKKI